MAPAALHSTPYNMGDRHLETISAQMKGPVAVVTLARPEVHNAFNAVMIAELTDVFRALSDDVAVRVIVLQSDGQSFSAGADLNWMRSMVDYSFEQNVADSTALADMIEAIRHCKKPTMARVQGHAFGGGVGLIAACDFVVAVEDAQFGFTEAKLGLMPSVISPVVLEKMNPAQARALFMTAERFDAHRGKELGLITDVVHDVSYLDHWLIQRINWILKNAPQAVSDCKMLVDAVVNASVDDKKTLTCEFIAHRRISDEGQEGMAAFLEKRPASWVSKIEE